MLTCSEKGEIPQLRACIVSNGRNVATAAYAMRELSERPSRLYRSACGLLFEMFRQYDQPTMFDFKPLIRSIPDFPTAGILFRDITPLLADPAAFAAAVVAMAEYVESRKVDAVVGIESRGFLFGTPIAGRLGLPFVPVRKPGKLPAERMSIEISLEYANTQLDIHADALSRGQRVVIVDDLLATGGTASGAVKLVELLGATVEGVVFLIELAGLRGRERLAGYQVRSFVVYD